MKPASFALMAGMVAFSFAHPVSGAEAAKPKEKILHSFGNGTDGGSPADLIDVNGMLYGLTFSGGTNCSQQGGCGTLYELDPKSGAETTLYSFCSQENCTDGRWPRAGLIDVNGVLYGTTGNGGGGSQEDCFDGCGSVFAFNPNTSVETVIYTFCSVQNCPDGKEPETDLLNANNILYGTTTNGGAHGQGVVYAIDIATGAESVLYSFCSQQNCADGENPSAGLIAVNGLLYGTTSGGGASTGGTVFSLDPDTGTETVLYSFCSQRNCVDGNHPLGSLINANGTLYGTTFGGGSTVCLAYGCGTIFSLDLATGAENVLYTFCSQQNCADGTAPSADLIDVKGTFYGTAQFGGLAGCGDLGCGTVFSLNAHSGVEKSVYSFCSQPNCTDGNNPATGLIAVKHKLYGATFYGGAYDRGTVFEIRHP